MRFCLLLFFCHTVYALSSDYVTVLRIIDGDSIVVSGTCAGVELPFSVRLQYLDTPEMRDGEKDNPHGIAAKNHLERLIKKGDKVRLVTSSKTFRADGHGRVLAMVFTKKNTCLQEYMIKHGYSVYWQRFGKVSERHKTWEALETAAKNKNIGLWNTQAEWMTKKSNE